MEHQSQDTLRQGLYDFEQIAPCCAAGAYQTLAADTLHIPKERLTRHNSGRVPHTSAHAPWEIHSAIAVHSLEIAQELEHYFKSHSGREWMRRHLEQ